MSDFVPSDPGSEQPLVFVDLETTGGSSAEHRITEIGVVEIGPLGVSTWTSLVNPGQAIPPFIQQLTGISDAMVRDAPTFASLAPALFERLDGKLFVAHNASFDRGFLRAEFERAGLAFNPDVLCTVRLSRALFPRESRHGLDALIERHGLVPAARHRALADADLIWQFWRQLHDIVPLERLRDQIARTTRHFRLGGDLTEAWLDTAPAGCGAYALFGERDEALYVGRSVRVRQRLRALLTGERRSSKEMRLAQQVRRVEWRETGNELGAMLAEAQWIARLRPSYNRRPTADAARAGGAPWPFEGAVAFEATGERRLFHVIDGWCYLGSADSLDAAARLVADAAGGAFEPFTHRLLQTHLARGLQVIPLVALTPAD
ncbi:MULTISPECIES: exonuclease domain-containing protein [unclassified Burkholderia]|uniref:exonuclease domain-containing protein n=1 Tax=unclassified Burkholderia TaxID=2613784 RepID=UPI00084C7C1E|nr:MULTISPECIES: exonuclease domain-containing protein [unclassified Burkholderia]RQU21989.1 DNA polymerase III subunit epsilon [Burkholderia cenocepacia]MBR8233899.1 DNA polymerase III subunit epsilon [Burkholderia sp. AU32357]MBY4872280.1 DNA polymerase III subunit epsilon [Burkholderia sp. AU42008]OED09205.1 DNA polymerase III subunit epsilon [Burkholderia sp. A2]OXI44388.1 DNA polymerase III subunit epsilon [Burkholderia sp. AU17457]